jgi:glucose/arabinose dehydrogenase
VNKTYLRLFFLISMFLSCSASGKDRQPIATRGICDGIPRLEVKTVEGYCLGLVAEGFLFPRGVLPEENGDLLVVDMGSWGQRKGSLWRVSKKNREYKKQRLLSGLDRPHAILKGSNGKIYLGSADKVSVVQMDKTGVSLIDVIGGSSKVPALPTTGRHPLKQFAFDSVGDLYLNVGSESDNCEVEGEPKSVSRGVCKEAMGKDQRGAIRKYRGLPDGTFESEWEIYASGLRNSMGLEFEKNFERLWQVENSRDSISNVDPNLDDALLPHDELNLVAKGLHYGWPYCYDMGIASPEYPTHDCSAYVKPKLLLPPHSAPLGIAFAQGIDLPGNATSGAFVTLHGYRSTGHRLVFLPFSSAGYPEGKIVDVVWGWDGKNSLPKGAPVDVRLGVDGAIYLTDDRNGLVLRLARVR